MKERPPIWRVGANILNKNRGQPKWGGAPAWGLDEALTTRIRKKVSCFEIFTQKRVTAVMKLRVP